MTIRYALLGPQASAIAERVLAASADGPRRPQLALVLGDDPGATGDAATLHIPPELRGDDVALDGWLLEVLLTHEVDLLVALGTGQEVGATTGSTFGNRILTLEALPDGVSGQPSVLISVRLWTADHDQPNPVIVQRTVPADAHDPDGTNARAKLLLHALGLLAEGAVDLDTLANE